MTFNGDSADFPESQEILIIDQAAVREEAMRALDDARTELEDLKTQLSAYKERDQPFFHSWLHRTFAGPLRELQQCVQEIRKKRLLIDSVLQEAILKGISYSEAHENVLADEAGFKPEDSDDDPAEEPGSAREKEEEEVARELFEEDLKEQGIIPDELDPVEYAARMEAFKAENGFSKGHHENFSEDDSESGQGGDCSRDGDSSRSRPEPHLNEMGQIKRLYRLLARRLHPDTGSEQSRESQALWLEAQNAYECSDLPRLEALWATLNEHDPDSFTSMISIADIQETVKQILKAVGGLKKEIRKAHKDPAWGFSLPAARKGKKVHKKIKVEIEGELSEAQDALQSLESLIDGWISEPVHGSARGAGRAGTFEEESAYGSQRSRGRSRSR